MYRNFWKKKSNIIHWFTKPKKILSLKRDKYVFYDDGKTNIAYNCVKKNIDEGRGNNDAIVFISEKNERKILTFFELEYLINHFISYLFKNFKKNELKKNNIAIHSSANLCSAISMLACMKLGITHCVIFNELSKEAIEIRCKLIKCKILISSASTKDFKKKIVPIKKKLKLKVLRFTDDSEKKFTINNEKFLNKKNIPLNIGYSHVKANKKSFILFTSGSTGEPKGIAHSTGGYLVYTKFSCINKFNISNQSTILTASDAGWINGHTYALYGPLSIGAKTILLEKPMSLLDSEILRSVLIDFKVNILYLPVTLIRLMKALDKKIKIKSKHLSLLGSMGEPLSKFVRYWFSKKFSTTQLQIVNTYFQTETAGIVSSPSFNDSIKKVSIGTVGKPISKYLEMFIEKTNSEIKIKKPWPGCFIQVINNKKLMDVYWDKDRNFRLFDLASYDKNKNIIIHGRLDDVINIRGHRIGSGEIESVLLKLKDIKEICVISVDDNLSGKKIIIFLVAKKKISKSIEDLIIKNFGTFALPERIIYLSELPKTRSGKILRRVLRELYLNPSTDKLGDLSTILNKNIIIEIKNLLINDE